MAKLIIEKEVRVQETIDAPDYFQEFDGLFHYHILNDKECMTVAETFISIRPIHMAISSLERCRPCTKEEFEKAFNESLNKFTQYATNQNS